jgi:hypothetical protein
MIPVAAIRSDLMFELRLIGTNDELIHDIVGGRSADEEFHARFYFFRGSLRSLYSARTVVNALFKIPEFERLISTVRPKFNEFNSEVARAAKEFDRLRNSIGGHIERSMADSRDLVADDLVLSVERTDVTGLVSAKLANVFLNAMLGGKGKIDEPASDDGRGCFERMSKASYACLGLMDLILRTYLKSIGR